jgi:hypothetical protein
MNSKIILITILFLVPNILLAQSIDVGNIGSGLLQNTAQNVIGSKYFGGTLLSSEYCSCSKNFVLTINDLYTDKIITLFFDLKRSRLNREYNIFLPMVKVLGSYKSNTNSVCLHRVYYVCVPRPVKADGQVTGYPDEGIGTSGS